MKKIMIAALLGFSALQMNAQIDMITSIKAMDGVTYTEYWDVTPVAGAKNTIGGKRYVATVKPVNDRFGHIVGFDAIDNEKPTEKHILYNYMYNTFDNYTHPSYMTSAAEHAYVIVNGCIFYLEHFESTTSFEIDAMWIPNVPKDKAADPVFKGAKMADMKSADLMKLIKDYFVEMQKIQAANPYSDEMQSQANTLKFQKDSTQLTYDQVNSAYWGSEEGQKKMDELRANSNKPTKKTVKNTGTGILTVMADNGATTNMNGGSSSQFPCRQNIYYAVKDASGNYTVKGALISGADADCGGTVNAAGN